MTQCIRGVGNYINIIQFTTPFVEIINNNNINSLILNTSEPPNLLQLDLTYTPISLNLLQTTTPLQLCRSTRQSNLPYEIILNAILNDSTNNSITITLVTGINGNTLQAVGTFNLNSIITTLCLEYYFTRSGVISKWTVFKASLTIN